METTAPWYDDVETDTPTVDVPPEIAGEIVRIEKPYARDLAVPRLPLIAIVVAATCWYGVGLLLVAVLRRGPVLGGRPSFKKLRTGPQYQVTPVWVRDDGGYTELEVHGHLSRHALARTDKVRVRARRQHRRDLPARATRIVNLTTGRTICPHRATFVSHVGLGVLLQAGLGGVLLVWVLASYVQHLLTR